jgi:hypothetical protein
MDENTNIVIDIENSDKELRIQIDEFLEKFADILIRVAAQK